MVDSSFGHRNQRLWFCVLWFEEEEERRGERCLVHQNEKRPHQVQHPSNLLTPFLFVPVLNPNPPNFFSLFVSREKKKKNHIKISALTNLLIIKKKKKKKLIQDDFFKSVKFYVAGCKLVLLFGFFFLKFNLLKVKYSQWYCNVNVINFICYPFKVCVKENWWIWLKSVVEFMIYCWEILGLTKLWLIDFGVLNWEVEKKPRTSKRKAAAPSSESVKSSSVRSGTQSNSPPKILFLIFPSSCLFP